MNDRLGWRRVLGDMGREGTCSCVLNDDIIDEARAEVRDGGR